MGTWLLVGFTVFVLMVACVFVVMNRDSSLIVGAALPAAIALASAIALVFVFNRPTSMSRTFQVAIVIEKASLLPVAITHRPFPVGGLTLAPQVQQIDPKTFHLPNPQQPFDFVQPLYHEYLQKMFVEELAVKQFGTWRMKTERFVNEIQWTPLPDASSYPSKILDAKDLERIFSGNRFARVHSFGPGQWALPPGTELRIDPPRADTQLGEVGIIHLKNGLCEISIRTIPTSFQVGLGKYAVLSGMHKGEDQDNYMTLTFITRIDAKFPWYRIGDPETLPHREWANAIIEELSTSFDEDSLWSQTKESFTFMIHYAPIPPGMNLPRPMHMGPSPQPPNEQETKTEAK